MTGLVLPFAVAVALLLLASVATTAREALERMSASRASRLIADEKRGADRLGGLLLDDDRTWAALSLTSTAAFAIGVGLLAASATADLGQPAGVASAAGFALLIGYPLVALVPRTAVRRNLDGTACRLSGFARLTTLLLRPLTTILVFLGRRLGRNEDTAEVQATEEAIRDLLDEAERGEIEPDERRMIHSIFELGDTLVREIMVPRPDVIMVSADQPLQEVVEVILANGYSRIPVHQGEDRDDIAGLLYAKDVLQRIHTTGNEDGAWTDLIRPPYAVPELKSVDGLLRELQAEQVHLAVVVDEYGALAGVVTIEDVLEEIVGEIVDEYDSEEPLVELLGPERWRIDARLPVDDLEELVGMDLPDDDWDTVGGLLFGLLGHVPRHGESVTIDRLQITAHRVRGRRIAEVLAEVFDEPQEEPGDESSAEDGEVDIPHQAITPVEDDAAAAVDPVTLDQPS